MPIVLKGFRRPKVKKRPLDESKQILSEDLCHHVGGGGCHQSSALLPHGRRRLCTSRIILRSVSPIGYSEGLAAAARDSISSTQSRSFAIALSLPVAALVANCMAVACSLVIFHLLPSIVTFTGSLTASIIIVRRFLLPGGRPGRFRPSPFLYRV